ncbi:MAG: hypothetical protein WC058_13580 [Phycisphaeraceae bacterium]
MGESIRISPTDHETLKDMAAKTGRKMSDLVSDAISELKRRFILESSTNGYHALFANKASHKAEKKESDIWDSATIADVDSEDWQ